MKLKEWVKAVEVAMEELLEEHADKDVVYSSDDEGNCFEPVHYAPGLISIGTEDGGEKEVVCIN